MLTRQVVLPLIVEQVVQYVDVCDGGGTVGGAGGAKAVCRRVPDYVAYNGRPGGT